MMWYGGADDDDNQLLYSTLLYTPTLPYSTYLRGSAHPSSPRSSRDRA